MGLSFDKQLFDGLKKISRSVGCVILDSSVSYGCHDLMDWNKMVVDGKIKENWHKSKRNGLEDLFDILSNSKACVCSGNLCNAV